MVSNRLNYLPALSSKTGESQEETAFTVKRARCPACSKPQWTVGGEMGLRGPRGNGRLRRRPWVPSSFAPELPRVSQDSPKPGLLPHAGGHPELCPDCHAVSVRSRHSGTRQRTQRVSPSRQSWPRTPASLGTDRSASVTPVSVVPIRQPQG